MRIFLIFILLLFLIRPACAWSYGMKVYSLSTNGKLIAVGSDGVYLFDLNGSLLWSRNIGQIWSVRIRDGYVVVGAGNDVYLFSKNGTMLWRFKTGGWVRSVAIGDGHVVAGSCDGNVYVFDLKGKLLWKHNTGDWVWCVDVGKGRVAVGTGHIGHRIFVFDLNGSLLWSYDVGDWNWVKAIRIGKIIVAGTRNFEVLAFDLNGRLLWKRETGNVWSVDVGRCVVVGADKVYAFDFKGRLLWSYKTRSNWVLSVAVGKKYVVAGSRDGCVYVFDLNGTPIMVHKTGDWVRGVAIVDGEVIAGSDKLYVLKIEREKVEKPKTPGFCIISALIALALAKKFS